MTTDPDEYSLDPHDLAPESIAKRVLENNDYKCAFNQVKIHPEDAMVVYRTPAIRRDEDEYSVEQLQKMSDEELDEIFYVILGGA
jgi:hypothetical protein